VPARASPSGFAVPYHFSITITGGFAFGYSAETCFHVVQLKTILFSRNPVFISAAIGECSACNGQFPPKSLCYSFNANEKGTDSLVALSISKLRLPEQLIFLLSLLTPPPLILLYSENTGWKHMQKERYYVFLNLILKQTQQQFLFTTGLDN